MRNKRQKTIRTHHRIRAALAIFLMIIGLGFSVLFLGGNSAKARPEAVQKYYTSVTVRPGDTLWSLAQQYAPEYSDIREYVDELIRINHLYSTESLRPGQSLVILYYQ